MLFFASLYHFAIRHKINYVISGGNIATEAVFPNSWHHSAMDATNLKAIHKKFGSIPLKEYQTISFMQYYFYYPFIKNMQVIRPLNYIQYSKELALSELKEKSWIQTLRKKTWRVTIHKIFSKLLLACEI
ncbi:adenine nucleotide alpha hydrolase family protein [Xenorhabdus nematophila]|uniref:hypothetical protein n=1 Tax=Xenorhabdus nematophila TaxID=628 RepID=UPI000AE5694C|nr:hypothetical protein [Xenorhabdus nematophila]